MHLIETHAHPMACRHRKRWSAGRQQGRSSAQQQRACCSGCAGVLGAGAGAAHLWRAEMGPCSVLARSRPGCLTACSCPCCSIW